MKILLVCSGKDIEMLSVMGPISKINPNHKVDMIVPARFKNQMMQLPNVSGVMCLSDFGIQDVFGWKKLPPKIEILFKQSYDKIIDLSMSVINPGFAISDPLEVCANVYSLELNKHLGGNHKCGLWLGTSIKSTLPPNSVLLEPLEYSFWAQAKPKELNELISNLKSYGMMIVSNNDQIGDLQLNLDLFSYVKVMAAASKVLCLGGVFSKALIDTTDAKVLNWSNEAADVQKKIKEVLISTPTCNDIESFLEENQVEEIDTNQSNALDDVQFVQTQFRNYLCREPSSEELQKHCASLKNVSREAKNLEMAYCAESVAKGMYRVKAKIYPAYAPLKQQMKVAVLLSGHLRTYEKTYPEIMSKLVRPLNADVFIHTWDGLGKQVFTNVGPIPDEQDKVTAENVQHFESHLRNIEVESNKNFLQNAKMKGKSAVIYGDRINSNTWRGLSADPVLIESQLYSVNKAFSAMEQYSLKHGKYDLVIRMRSDLSPNGLLPEFEHGLDDKTIYVPAPPQNQHDHPPCPACQMSKHEGEHGTDVCDIFAYGTQTAMKTCCELWSNLEEVWSLCEKQNQETFKMPLLSGKVGIHTAVNIWHSHNSHRINCFYPERLLRKYLKDYRLVGSKLGTTLVR